MFCILAFVVLSIMGLFSASHRELARQAWQCVWLRVTLRPCTVGFREKMKGRLVAALLRRSSLAAKILNKHFELFSWAIVLLTIISTLWAFRGVYNYYFYGSCNGLNSSGFCVFDPTGANNQVSSLTTQCASDAPTEASLTLSPVPVSEFPTKNNGAKNKIVFIGCYSCDYTRKSYPEIQTLVKETGAEYTFINFPVHTDTQYLTAYTQCVSQQSPEKFWKWNDDMFAASKADVANPEFVQTLLTTNGIDPDKILTCVNSTETKTTVDAHMKAIRATGLYGTPTIFFNGRAYVGPKPYRVYRNALRWFRLW